MTLVITEKQAISFVYHKYFVWGIAPICPIAKDLYFSWSLHIFWNLIDFLNWSFCECVRITAKEDVASFKELNPDSLDPTHSLWSHTYVAKMGELLSPLHHLGRKGKSSLPILQMQAKSKSHCFKNTFLRPKYIYFKMYLFQPYFVKYPKFSMEQQLQAPLEFELCALCETGSYGPADVFRKKTACGK